MVHRNMDDLKIGTLLMALLLISGSASWAQEIIMIRGKPLTKVTKQLRSSNRGLQMRAARVLAKAPEAAIPKIVPNLITILKSDRQNDRFVAAQVLGEYGPKARASVAGLLPVLQGTQYERNRTAAAKALGLILKDAQPSKEIEAVTQALMKLFDDKYSDVRREAVKACGMIGVAAKACIPELARMLNDGPKRPTAENYMVRAAAGWTIGRMGKLGAEHIDHLISCMHARSPNAPEFVDAIAAIGPVHENVIPNVIDKLEKSVFGGYPHTNQAYAIRCMAALERFGGQSADAVTLLTRIIETRNAHRQPKRAVQALKTLAAIGSPANRAVPSIKKFCLPSRDAEVKATAENTLALLIKKKTP